MFLKVLLFQLDILLRENLAHAHSITTKIVQKHVVFLTLLTDVSVVVGVASQNVHVTSSLEKMVIFSAFKTTFSIIVELHAFSDGELERGEN